MSELRELDLPASETRTDGVPVRKGTSLGDRVRSLRLKEAPKGAEAPSRVIPWALCAVSLLAAAAFGYRAYRVAPAAVAPSADSSSTASEVSSAARTAQADSGDVVLQSKGYVIPAHQIQVSPKIPGMIVWLNPKFEEGQRFREGDELARLEDVDYRSERDQARAGLEAAEQKYEELNVGFRPEEKEQARAELEEARRNLHQLRLDLDRSQRLSAGNALAQREYEQAKYGHDAMESRARRLEFAYKLVQEGPRQERILAAKAEMHQARANLTKAEWRLENCIIRAPVTGTILSKKAEKGNIVNPIAFNIAASLCDMADLSDLEVDLTIQERDIAQVEVGQRCVVMPEAFQNHEPFRKKHPHGYDGWVSRLMPIADRAKGAIPVRVKIRVPRDEEGIYLKPEMGVLVSFKKTTDAEPAAPALERQAADR